MHNSVSLSQKANVKLLPVLDHPIRFKEEDYFSVIKVSKVLYNRDLWETLARTVILITIITIIIYNTLNLSGFF